MKVLKKKFEEIIYDIGYLVENDIKCVFKIKKINLQAKVANHSYKRKV
jgi:hypothetical protein